MEPIKIQLKSDRNLIHKDSPTERILEIIVNAPSLEKQQDLPPFNLGLVIDRSGSMSGGKLDQVKSAVMRILNLLHPSDLVSLVTFDDTVRTLCNGVPATESNKRKLVGVLQSLQAGGSTALCAGYLEGCRCVANAPMEGRLNRVLLLTDGEANVGITDERQISNYTSELFERGIVTSTFGVGLGFNEILLQMMADRGGGNTYYIQAEDEIGAFLLREFSEMAAISARKTEITLTFPPDCTLQVFGEWRHRFHAGILHISLSDLAAESVTRVMIKALTPAGDGDLTFKAAVRALDAQGVEMNDSASLSLQYGSSEEVEQSSSDQALLGTFASVLLGHVTREAIHLEREMKFKDAEALLQNTLDEYGSYASAAVRSQFDELKERIRFGLDEGTRKNFNQVSYMMRKTRHPDQQS